MKRVKANLYDFFGINLIPPFLKDGIVISFILHVFFLVLIMVSPYIRVHSFIPMIKYDEPIIVDLDNLIVGKETILPPAPPLKQEVKKVEEKKSEYFKPEIKKEELPPPSVPKEVKDEKKDNVGNFIEETKKEVKKEIVKDIKKERMGGLDDLLASVDGLKHTDQSMKEKEINKMQEEIKSFEKDKSADSSKNFQQNSTADFIKNQMAISYIDAIRIKLKSCWHLDPGAKDVKNMKIVIRTSVSPDGNINNIEILNKEEYLSSPWFKAIADSAKRALIICSPYSLPIEFYQDWKDIVFTFYPDKKSVK